MKEKQMYSYTECLKEINEKGQFAWQNFVEKHKVLATMLIISIAPIIILDLLATNIQVISPITLLLGISGGSLVVLSVIYYKSESSYKMLIIGWILIGIHMRILWIIFGLIITYYLYHLIKTKQLKKIAKYASMTPKEIAKIKDKKEPKVELTVRGDWR